MVIKDGFVLRTVMGQHIVVAEGSRHHNFNKMISLNESAALLWKSVQGRRFSTGDLAKILVDNYSVGSDVALADAEAIAVKWVENGLVDA